MDYRIADKFINEATKQPTLVVHYWQDAAVGEPVHIVDINFQLNSWVDMEELIHNVIEQHWVDWNSRSGRKDETDKSVEVSKNDPQDLQKVVDALPETKADMLIKVAEIILIKVAEIIADRPTEVIP